MAVASMVAVAREMPPEQMTTRARLYLIVSGLRNAILGASMLWQAEKYTGQAFQALFDIAPRWAWIVSLFVGAGHLLYASARGSEGHARTALIISCGVSAMWCTAFGLVALDGIASLLATTLFGALSLKDLIVCAQPMRSPFEAVVRLYQKG